MLNAGAGTPHSPLRRFLITAAWGLILLAAAFVFVKCEISLAGNETSRLAVIQSLVDNGTFDITNSLFRTPDKAFLNGKYYGDKPPLLTWLSAGEYFLLARVFGLTFENAYHTVIFLLYLPYFLVSAATGFIFFILLTDFLPRAPLPWRIAASALSVLSTLVFSYSVTIGNHGVCAFLLMLLLLRMRRAEEHDMRLRDAFYCGLVTGLIFNCEFVLGGVCGLGIFFFCITWPGTMKLRVQRGLCYIAGAALLIACEGLMNAAAYGSPLPLYLLTHKPDIAHKDYLYYAWNVLFGFEGFFLYMPACLFIFPVLCRPFPGRGRAAWYILSCCLGATLLFLAGTSDYGGFCYGYRFLVPIAPVLLLYVFLSFHVKKRKGLCGGILALALLWGVITSLAGTLNPWNSGYEGSLTPAGNMNEQIRNGFLVNATVLVFELAPESALSKFLIERVYGAMPACYMICEEYLNRREDAKARAAYAWFAEHYAQP